MPEIMHSAQDMIAGMTPSLRAGSFIFVSVTDKAIIAALSPHAIATFMETEGQSMVIPVELAKKSNLNIDHPMRCITLNVYSSLEGVGLTAAVSTALSKNAIPCNMIAAHHHDHVFVPADMSARAMEVLMVLQRQSTK